MKKIVLFASGSGSNVENIAAHFKNRSEIIISCVFTNKTNAFVIERCQRLKLPVLYFNKTAFYHADVVFKSLLGIKPDLIVLAGFLWKVPEKIILAFRDKIINIHPSLLPKYGGKGMYGMHVHRAVKENNEFRTGITIHYVNEHYDKGDIILQKEVTLDPKDDAEAIAEKVHRLEYAFFPETIEKLLLYGQ